jgi:hypothetical protein
VRVKEVFVELGESARLMMPRPLGSSQRPPRLGRRGGQLSGNPASLASRSSMAYIGPLRGPAGMPPTGMSG